MPKAKGFPTPLARQAARIAFALAKKVLPSGVAESGQAGIGVMGCSLLAGRRVDGAGARIEDDDAVRTCAPGQGRVPPPAGAASASAAAGVALPSIQRIAVG